MYQKWYEKCNLAKWRVLVIYKSAVSLMVRRQPHRHPLAALGRRSQAHAQTDKQNKTERKRGGRGAVSAEPLRRRLPLFPPRIAFFHRVLPLLFCTVKRRRAMLLSAAALSLRGLPARYIRRLSSIRSCRRGVFSCPLSRRDRRCPRP